MEAPGLKSYGVDLVNIRKVCPRKSACGLDDFVQARVVPKKLILKSFGDLSLGLKKNTETYLN